MGKIKYNKSGKIYTADYVVIGGGLAGCVMASKLSNDKTHSVICIEGGRNNITDVPIVKSSYAGIEYSLATEYFPEYFWQQKPVPNGTISGFGGSCDLNVSNCINGSCINKTQSDTTVGDYTTGKILGGGTSINGQQYVRGSNALFDEWATIGGPQWSSTEATKMFKEMENYNGLTSNMSVHGYSGPINIRQTPSNPTDMATKFANAVSVGCGVPLFPNDDYNDPATLHGSFTKWQLAQRPNHIRESSATAYLGPTVMNSHGDGIDDRKLLVLFNTYANTIIWEKRGDKKNRCQECINESSPHKAYGVRIVENGISKEIYARKKVIVCLGIYSAEFLQRSGIGPSKLLQNLKINVIYDNPNVGKNFTNQLFSLAVFTADINDVGVPETDPDALYAGGAFLPVLIPEENTNKRGYQLIGASPSPGQFFIIISPLQPHSKGIVRIQSKDPFTVSLADNNYMGDPLDMKSFVAAFQIYIKNLAIELEKNEGYQLVMPSMDMISNTEDTTELEEYIMSSYNHTHHWMSSNKMAKTPADGVVDGWGNVFGVCDLIVVDNSIAPVISDGNTSAPIYFLANVIANNIIANQ